MSPEPRPRMVFFRWARSGLPDFLADHAREQVKSLGQFFDIAVVDWDCDYDLICDQLQPDLCVFESGVYAGDRAIRNTSSHPQIPKLGFLHADAFDSSRAAFVADMARWDVRWFFTTSMSMAEYTPEIADRLFVWPNAIDPDVFRDYGLPKNIPVLFTGSQAWHYPWRNSVSRAIAPEFVTMTMPHFGWGQGPGTERLLHGEDYARLLNASTFVPTCGTVARDVVRKHLEIPASMACLVTERTAAIEAFGFEDLVNCVFADERDVVDKLDHLIRHPDELERVTRAGHRLVHDRHAIGRRSQVLQWYQLVNEHGTEIELAQRWPDGDLTLASAGRHDLQSAPIVGSGKDRELLASGWLALLRGEYSAGQRDFLRCMNYYFMPEGALGLAFAHLLQGDRPGALAWMSRALSAAMSYYGSPEPDPVQWACDIRIRLCSGDVEAAQAAAAAFPAMSHPELDRIRAVVAFLAGTSLEPARPPARASVCPVPAMTQQAWTGQLRTMLTACGQRELAARLVRWDEAGPHGADPGAGKRTAGGSARGRRRVGSRLAAVRRGGRSAPERWLRSRLSPLKRRLLSNAWSRFVGDYASREPITHAVLVLGSDRSSKSTRALKRGLLENPELRGATSIISTDPIHRVGGRPLTPAERAELSRRAAGSLNDLGQAAKPLVFLTRSGSSVIADPVVLDRAATVILEGANEPSGYRILADLLHRKHFDLVDHRPEQGAGYAVLRRRRPVAARHTFPDDEWTISDEHPPG